MEGAGLDEESKGTESVGEGAGGEDGFEEVGVGRALSGGRRRVGFGIIGKESGSTFCEGGKLGGRGLLEVRLWGERRQSREPGRRRGDDEAHLWRAGLRRLAKSEAGETKQPKD